MFIATPITLPHLLFFSGAADKPLPTCRLVSSAAPLKNKEMGNKWRLAYKHGTPPGFGAEAPTPELSESPVRSDDKQFTTAGKMTDASLLGGSLRPFCSANVQDHSF